MAEFHFDDSKPDTSDPNVPWYKLLTRYHWFVLGVSALGWLFDCLDQQLFVLARPAVMETFYPDSLLGTADKPGISPADLLKLRSEGGNTSTSVFMAGWALGGIFFGVLGDRLGRAKTMMITILLYSLFTGLSSFSTGLWDFCLYRFLTGLGVGGEFAVGVALVSEVMPNRARPYTLGLLQALSAVGNVSAAVINLGLGVAEETGMVDSPWRIMFMIGALPALLALVIRSKLKEPEAWQRQQELDKDKKSHFLTQYAELFGDPRWRKHALLGLLLGCSGIIGLWSVGFFTPDLIRTVARPAETIKVYDRELAKTDLPSERQALIKELRQTVSDKKPIPAPLADLKSELDKKVNSQLSHLASYTSIAINVGAFFGMFGFGALSQRIGRKPTFVIALLAAFTSTVSVFWFLTDFWQIWVLVPIMGFCQLSLFAGYAIYFPELFPTRLRSTGTSFCYNVGRFVAAFGPLVKSMLEAQFINTPDPLRYAGMSMCSVFLIGLFVLPFLPETRGKPLPE